MRSSVRAFSTQVKLPCTLSWEFEKPQKLHGTALKIEPESMVLRVAAGAQAFPRVGDKVNLEVHLPVNSELAGAKDLSVRGSITEMTEMRDGARQFILTFRRAHFKDRESKGHEAFRKRKAVPASNGIM